MRRDEKITFVSPVIVEGNVVGGNRVTVYCFHVMQAGEDPLRLEYATMKDAHEARKQIIKPDHVYAVPTSALFLAIQSAMQALVDQRLNID